MTDDTDDFLFAQHVGLNSPDFIFAFWGSVAWAPLISFYFSGAQPHLAAPQGDNTVRSYVYGCLSAPLCSIHLTHVSGTPIRGQVFKPAFDAVHGRPLREDMNHTSGAQVGSIGDVRNISSDDLGQSSN